jgi:prepilin-type processing-associated H-X9-DG protein
MDLVSDALEPDMSITRNVFAGALTAFAALGLLSTCRKPSSLADQQNCKQQLRSVWSAVALYRYDHTNQWPSTLESLDKDMVGRLLKCPGAKANSAAVSQSDYFYVDWSKIRLDPNAPSGKYPLMYDRHASNHEGRGINVLMVDGSVEWDSNGDWLRKFAADHPDAKVPMPE